MSGAAGAGWSRSRVLALLAAGGLLVASCSESLATPPTGSSGSPAASTPVASAGSPAATALAPSPVPTNAAGIRTCVSSSEEQERTCRLDPGVYATEFFEPALRYTVPSAGWASLNREVAPGNFHLFPPGGSLFGMQSGATDDITVLAAVAPPGRCSGEPSTSFAPTFTGLIDFLTTNPRIAVERIRDASVAGLEGKALDLAFLESDGCGGAFADILVGIDPSHGAFGLSPRMAGARLYLLHLPGTDAAFAILIDDARDGGSDYGDGEDWYSVAQDVIDSFVISR